MWIYNNRDWKIASRERVDRVITRNMNKFIAQQQEGIRFLNERGDDLIRFKPNGVTFNPPPNER